METDNSAVGRPSPQVADDSGTGFDPHYLAAKKSIDDRALNHYVWKALCQALPQTTGAEPANIVEIGAGIGTMLTRVVDWGLLTSPATYLATDCDAGHLRLARRYLAAWADERGHALHWPEKQHGRLCTAQAVIALISETVRAEEMACRTESEGTFHLVIAHAVLDLIDLPAVLPGLLSQLTDNGLAYFTCNFDGTTLFLPGYPGGEEQEILRRYHASMEARLTGASRTGRRLLSMLQGPGLELLAAGSSDWIIHPRHRTYSEDEVVFLHALIAGVEQELAGKSGPPPPGLAAWARNRHRQVEAGALTFVARNLDLLARLRPPLP